MLSILISNICKFKFIIFSLLDSDLNSKGKSDIPSISLIFLINIITITI